MSIYVPFTLTCEHLVGVKFDCPELVPVLLNVHAARIAERDLISQPFARHGEVVLIGVRHIGLDDESGDGA